MGLRDRWLLMHKSKFMAKIGLYINTWRSTISWKLETFQSQWSEIRN